MEVMDCEKVCFACHRVMSIHTRKNLQDCLEDLTDRLRNIEQMLETNRGYQDILHFAVHELGKKV